MLQKRTPASELSLILRMGGILAKCGVLLGKSPKCGPLLGILVDSRPFVIGQEIIFDPYLSISACAIEVQHNNENSSAIFIDMFAPKWPRALHKLAHFALGGNTIGYWA